MNPNANEIIGEHQHGFRLNRLTIEYIFSIRQRVKMKWKYSNEVRQLFMDFEKPRILVVYLNYILCTEHLIVVIKICLDGTQV